MSSQSTLSSLMQLLVEEMGTLGEKKKLNVFNCLYKHVLSLIVIFMSINLTSLTFKLKYNLNIYLKLIDDNFTEYLWLRNSHNH